MHRDDWLPIIARGDAPHAIFLAGPHDSGQDAFALRAAARFLLHSDETEKLSENPFFLNATDHSAAAVRDLLHLLNQQAFDRGRRCVLLSDAHKMNLQCQNALLKTFEEPPPDTLLLLTGLENGLLPTIRSRCMLLRAESEPWETVAQQLVREGVAPQTAQLCAKCSDGVLDRARAFAEPANLSFRTEALRALSQYAQGMRPYPEAQALCTRVETDDAEQEDEGKKKKRVSAALVDRFLDVLLSLCADVLKRQCGVSDFQNIDCIPLQKIFAATFTTAQIQGMIGVALEAKKMLFSQAAPSQTLDWILAKLP